MTTFADVLNLFIMKKSTILALLMMVSATAMALSPWKKGAFETGQYRNLLVEMGYSQADVDAKLKEVFNDVFRGPNKVYFEVGDSMGYVSDVKNHDARTEGMSYGLPSVAMGQEIHAAPGRHPRGLLRLEL